MSSVGLELTIQESSALPAMPAQWPSKSEAPGLLSFSYPEVLDFQEFEAISPVYKSGPRFQFDVCLSFLIVHKINKEVK